MNKYIKKYLILYLIITLIMENTFIFIYLKETKL